jgi:hypothetical protein
MSEPTTNATDVSTRQAELLAEVDALRAENEQLRKVADAARELRDALRAHYVGFDIPSARRLSTALDALDEVPARGGAQLPSCSSASHPTSGPARCPSRYRTATSTRSSTITSANRRAARPGTPEADPKCKVTGPGG